MQHDRHEETRLALCEPQLGDGSAAIRLLDGAETRGGIVEAPRKLG
jgi:hypothetical protein